MYRNRAYTSRYSRYSGRIFSSYGRGYSPNRSKYATLKRVRQAEQSVGYLKSLVETKYTAYSSSGAVTEIDGTDLPINALSLTALTGGTAQSQVVGTQVSWKNMVLRYSLKAGWDSINGDPYVHKMRILVIWQKQWNEKAAAYPISFYLVDSGSPNPTTDLLAYYRWSNRKQFRVLHDKLYLLVDKESEATHMGGSFSIPLKNRKTIFNVGAPAANTNIETGAIFIYVLSDCPNAFVQPHYNLMCDLYYEDT